MGDWGSIPGTETSAGGGHGNPLSILAWRIPWTEESRGYSPRGRKESDTTEWLTPTHGAETEADGTQQIFFFSFVL